MTGEDISRPLVCDNLQMFLKIVRISNPHTGLCVDLRPRKCIRLNDLFYVLVVSCVVKQQAEVAGESCAD